MARANKIIDMDFDSPADDGAGELVTKKMLMAITGMTPHNMETAIARGAPVETKGATKKEGYRINTAKWLAWMVADKIAQTDPLRIGQTKLMNANAALKIDKLEKLEAITLTKGQVVQLYSDEATIVRTHLGTVAKRCAALVSTESDPGICEDIIAEEINSALGEISGGDGEVDPLLGLVAD